MAGGFPTDLRLSNMLHNFEGAFHSHETRAGSMAGMRTIVGLVLSLLVMMSSQTLRGEEASMRSISVSGTVDTKVAPDQIVWQISLTAADANLAKAKARSDEQAKAVVALQKKLAIGAGDLQTGVVTVYREYDRGPRGERGNFKEFVVTRGITIRERDLQRFDEFLDALLSSSDMEASFVFESSKFQEIRSESRLKALHVAKEKAVGMAEALGAKLGKVLTISEHAITEPGRNPMSNTSYVQSTVAPDATTETFVPGAISISASVNVTFELE